MVIARAQDPTTARFALSNGHQGTSCRQHGKEGEALIHLLMSKRHAVGRVGRIRGHIHQTLNLKYTTSPSLMT